MSLENIGKWSFLIGIVIAVIAAFVGAYEATIMLVLFILGIIVGFLNISEKDVVKFLVAVVALVTFGIAALSALSVLDVVSDYVNKILSNFVAFVGAAGLVVAIKAVVEASKK